MAHIFFLILLPSIAIVSLARPWIGIVCAYAIIVLQPQALWYWAFGDMRPELWVTIPTLLGILIEALRGRVAFAALRSKRNVLIAALWLCLMLSYFFGPFTEVESPYRFENPTTIIYSLDSIMLLYFMGCVCINSETKLKALFVVICLCGVYLIYWANDQYLSHRVIGRLQGPTDANGMGLYHDENAFAMVFVVVLPFLWHLGASFKRRVWRWGWWLVIPFCWHAVFLTASRGGLIGLAVTTVLIGLRSKRRMIGLALIPAFLFVFLWQGGDLMKGRAETINGYQQDASAEERIHAWTAAWAMIKDHPLLGVGLGSFGPAYPSYASERPREAHNTYLQIAAENGIIAGLAYILIVVTTLVSLVRLSRAAREREGESGLSSYHIVEATLIGLMGFATCALFLSLQIFEIFYCLVLMASAALYLSQATAGTIEEQALPLVGLQTGGSAAG